MPLTDAEELELLMLEKEQAGLPNAAAGVPHETSTLSDVGYSAAGAPQEAIARGLGLPSGIAEVAGKALTWPVEKVAGAISPRFTQEVAKIRAANPRAGRAPLPDTAFFKRQMDAAANALLGGDSSIFYEPQTEAGRLTQEGLVGGFTGAVAGPMGAASGVTGGVAGEAVRKATENYPTISLIASMAASLLGGAVPFAARGLWNVAQPGRALQGTLDNVPPEQLQQAQNLMDDAAARGVPLTGPEAIQQVVGGQTRLGTLQRAVEQSPAGEAVMRPMLAARPEQVRAAGQTMLGDVFGTPVTPENAMNRTQGAAEGMITQAVRERTAQSGPSFQDAAGQEKNIAGLDDFLKNLDERIRLAGNSDLGRALGDYRKRLTVEPNAQGQTLLGPLNTVNREVARKLQLKYDPTMGALNEGLNPNIGGELGPLNKQLTDILANTSPDYAGGLQKHIAASPAVERLTEGPVGRLAQGASGAPDTALKRMADEFLDPELARPQTIRQLAADIGKADPTAVRDLVGTRLRNMFDKATADLQSGPNPWGGAGFVKDVMGNPQSRANLQATIETLPDGKQLWKGWQNFAQVLQATGKRLPRGSDTQVNLGVEKQLREGGNLVQGAANVDLSRPLGMLGGQKLNDLIYNANSRKLAEVFTDPRAVEKMKELAVTGPQSRRAELLAAELLNLGNAVQRPEGPLRINIGKQPGDMLNLPTPAGVLPLPPAQEMIPAGRPQSLNLRGNDRDTLIRTIYGEAAGEGPEGQAAVAHVVLNRLQDGQSVSDVVKAPNQFEPWNSKAGRQKMAKLRPQSPEYQRIAQVVDQVLAAGEDPTGGATHFFAPEAQAAAGRELPQWAKKLRRTAQVGGHVFYR